MGPEDLAQVLRHLPKTKENADLLVGTETSDDAGVYRLSDELALVQSVDYFTPIVDDPYDYGAIAAANAFSDIYAMGGRPLTALNLIGFPLDDLPAELMAEILRGGSDKAREAGATIVGGHSIDDREPKYGMAVTGLAHPAEILRNTGAQVGDLLYLTKPIGIGIMTTAIKNERLDEAGIVLAVATMAALNDTAAEAAVSVGARAATDVTGFGLLGHAHELAAGSGVALEIHAERVPVLEPAWQLAAQDLAPGGSHKNLAWAHKWTRFDGDFPAERRIVFADAITSGGLLISVAPDRADALAAALQEAGTLAAAQIGQVVEGEPGTIRLSG